MGPRRFALAGQMAREVNRIRTAHTGVPPPDALASLVAAAAEAGGVPRAAAEVLASYSRRPLVDGAGPVPGPVVAGGRLARSRAGAGPRARRVTTVPHQDRALAFDAAVTDFFLRVAVRLSPSKVSFTRELVRRLTADTDQSRSTGRTVRGVAAALVDLDAPVRLDLVAEDGPTLTVAVEGSGHDLVGLVGPMALGAGLVHGRLGIVTRVADQPETVTHWELVRRVSPGVRAYLRDVVRLAGTGEATAGLVEPGAAMGLPADSLARNLPRLLDVLAPVAADLAMACADDIEPPETVPVVTDDLGLFYGLADLLAARPVTI